MTIKQLVEWAKDNGVSEHAELLISNAEYSVIGVVSRFRGYLPAVAGEDANAVVLNGDREWTVTA